MSKQTAATRLVVLLQKRSCKWRCQQKLLRNITFVVTGFFESKDQTEVVQLIFCKFDDENVGYFTTSLQMLPTLSDKQNSPHLLHYYLLHLRTSSLTGYSLHHIRGVDSSLWYITVSTSLAAFPVILYWPVR